MKASFDVAIAGCDDTVRVLLIEDDYQIAKLVTTEFTEAGYLVDWAKSAEGGLKKYDSAAPALIVLDLTLPDLDGLTVCERVRALDPLIPILMLTARAGREAIVRGLELGADDYLTKPFDALELIARARALLRRIEAHRARAGAEKLAAPLCCGSLVIDAVRREAMLNGSPLALTAREFDLLLLFAKHPGRAFTRDELLSRVWGQGFDGFAHTVNTHINRLRSKVESDAKNPSLIETVWGVGYRFARP